MSTITGTQGIWAVDLVINEDENSLDPINNTSNLNWEIILRTLSGSAWIGGYPTITITIANRQAYSATIPAFFGSPSAHVIGTSGVKIVSGVLENVEHDDDGYVKNNTASFSWLGDGLITPSDVSASGTFDASQISRRSTISATRTYFGEPTSINVKRYVDTFTHSIAYSFGTQSGYITSMGTFSQTEEVMNVLNIQPTIPVSWMQEIPNNQYADCTLTIKTYSGTLQIGTSYSTTFRIYVDEGDYSPLVTSSVTDTNNDAYTLTGSYTTLIKGFSIPSVSYITTPRGYSTLSEVYINDNLVETTPYPPFTLTTNTITIRAVDSRGLSTEQDVNFTLISYVFPTIYVDGYRENPTDTNINIRFNGTFFNGSFGATNNAIQNIKWLYKSSDESDSDPWNTGGTLVLNTDYKVSNDKFYSGDGDSMEYITIGNSLDYTKEYKILLVVEDKVTQNTTISSKLITIPRGYPVINWEEDFVNVNGDIRQYNVSILNDFNYVIDQEVIIGTWDNKTHYRKTMEITGGISQGTSTMAHNISNVDIININMGKSFMWHMTNYKSHPFPINQYNSAGSFDRVDVSVDRTNINFIAETSWGNNWVVYITLEYTKTTS